MIVCLDADILSSLAKIKRLDMLNKQFANMEIFMIEKALSDWIQIKKLPEDLKIKALKLKTTAGLGCEADAIVLAKAFDGIFLSNDNDALCEAEKTGLISLNIQNLIQDAILSGLINSSGEVRQIKSDLKKYDYFEFKREINRFLVEMPKNK
jgi:predicted nucleic acid-binding protein